MKYLYLDLYFGHKSVKYCFHRAHKKVSFEKSILRILNREKRPFTKPNYAELGYKQSKDSNSW